MDYDDFYILYLFQCVWDLGFYYKDDRNIPDFAMWYLLDGRAVTSRKGRAARGRPPLPTFSIQAVLQVIAFFICICLLSATFPPSFPPSFSPTFPPTYLLHPLVSFDIFLLHPDRAPSPSHSLLSLHLSVICWFSLCLCLLISTVKVTPIQTRGESLSIHEKVLEHIPSNSAAFQIRNPYNFPVVQPSFVQLAKYIDENKF